MNDLSKKTSIEEERRVAPRYNINLKSSVLITAIRTSSDGEEDYLILQGQLRDVSITGLALIISSDNMRELKMFGEDFVLRLLLPLPIKAIELEAVPVRFQRIDKSKNGSILVGAHITNMNGRDRILFMDFIRENEAAQKLKVSSSAG